MKRIAGLMLITLLLVLTCLCTVACGKEYVVSFCDGDACSTQTVKSGSRAVEPTAPEKHSYSFKEWQLDGKEYDFDTKVKSDISLTAAWEMIDYADKVYLNTAKYPVLEDQGLFTVVWNNETNMPEYKRAWSDAGAAAINPDKPTVVLIHGWLATVPDAQIHRLPDTINPVLLEKSYYDADDLAADGKLYQSKTWLDEGWNVLSFDYNRFATAFIFEAEESIYFGGHIAYMNDDGSWSDYDASEYSLCQFFAAEYIRTMLAVGDNMGSQEIRLTGHSLGGIMTVTSANLLYELSKAGQLPSSQVPERIALLDTYVTFSAMLSEDLSYYPPETHISWSDTAADGGDRGKTYLNYVKNMSEGGIAIELYLLDAAGAFNSFRVPCLSFDGRILEVMDYTATVIYCPRPCSADMPGSGHNAIREFYYESIVKGTGKLEGGSGISAKSTGAEIIAEKGKVYRITEGDDAFKTDLMLMELKDKDSYGCPYGPTEE